MFSKSSKVFFIGFIILLPAKVFFQTRVLEDHLAASKEVEKVIKTSDFEKLKTIVEDWKHRSKYVQKHILLYLVQDLDSTKKLKLDNYADMFILSRVLKGKMHFHGHGYLLDQDIFIESGRRAWAIERLLNIQLPPFTENMQGAELDKAVQESFFRIIKAMKIP